MAPLLLGWEGPRDRHSVWKGWLEAGALPRFSEKDQDGLVLTLRLECAKGLVEMQILGPVPSGFHSVGLRWGPQNVGF